MFYCEDCAKENEWPEVISKSYGRCEICYKSKLCYDVQSKDLPLPKWKREEQEELKKQFSGLMPLLCKFEQHEIDEIVQYVEQTLAGRKKTQALQSEIDFLAGAMSVMSFLEGSMKTVPPRWVIDAMRGESILTRKSI